MRKLALLTFVTIDGVMQAPSSPEEDSSGGFTQGGWAAPYWAEVMEQVRQHAMPTHYDILFGRKTYDLFAPHFSTAENTGTLESERLNAATKYVVTSNRQGLDWPESIAIQGNIANEIAQLKQQDGPLLQVHGSWQLIQELLSNGLVDEFRLWTFPTIVGRGKRLFGDGSFALNNLALSRCEATTGGAVMSIYQRN